MGDELDKTMEPGQPAEMETPGAGDPTGGVTAGSPPETDGAVCASADAGAWPLEELQPPPTDAPPAIEVHQDAEEGDPMEEMSAASEIAPDAASDSTEAAAEASAAVADAEAEAMSEPAPEPVPEPAPEPEAAIDVAALQGEVETQRAAVLGLLEKEPPAGPVVQQVVQPYQECVRKWVSAGGSLADEGTAFRSAVEAAHAAALAKEQAVVGQQVEAGVAERGLYARLSEELVQATQSVADVLGLLKQDDERLAAAEPVRDALLNYRRGIEIILRMLTRLKDKLKPVEDAAPASVLETLTAVPVPEAADGWAAFVEQTVGAYFEAREANYLVREQAVAAAADTKRLSRDLLKGLIAVIDGIDSGLENETELRDSLLAQCSEDEGGKALVTEWCVQYTGLDRIVTEFMGKTGIRAHEAKEGEMFDPNTMEPQGTVADPELPNEAVAATSRRGFSLDGEMLRPILVEVVRNE